MDEFYQTSYTPNSAYQQQANIDKKFKAGDQNLQSMWYGSGSYYNSRRYFFNLLRRHSNMICGFQRKNRKSTVTVPFQQDSDDLCDDYNKVIRWCEDRDGFQEYFSQSFEGSTDVGINLLHMYPDYTLDPVSGDLFTDQVSFQNFLIDPFFRKMDLTDCNGIWRRRWVSRNQAMKLAPGYASEIKKIKPSGMKDGRFPLQAELINIDTNGLFSWDEFYYPDTREATVILDPMTEESSIFDADEEELAYILNQQPWLRVAKQQVPTTRMAISLGSNVIYNGPNLLGIDRYPFVPNLCYHEPDLQSYSWRIQGIIRGGRDAQHLYNVRKVIELDLLQSQVQNAWVYPVDAVVDSKAFRQTENGCVIPLKAGFTPDSVKRLDPQSIPESVVQLSNLLAEDITRIIGTNDELLGAATDDKAGVLSMLRQGAGLTTLQPIFDKADYAQRLYGEIRLEAILKNFSKTKIRQILGHEPNERFFSASSLKFAIQVEEGNYSATQRQTELQQLLHFREIGVIDGPVASKAILRSAFITNKKQLSQEMEEQNQQQAQQAQAQAQQQAEVERSKVMSSYSKSRLDLAKEQELLAQSDQLKADAHRKELESDLDLVKMMVELEDMEFNQIANSFRLAQEIKERNRPQEQVANV